MDRRFVIWLALSFCLLVIFSPKPKPPQPQQQPAEPAVAQNDAAVDEPAAAPAAIEADDQSAAQTPPLAEPLPAEEGIAPQWLMLGSVDEKSDYRMLVTLTNRGATVERIELASPRFSDLQDRGGYLGHLTLRRSTDGAVVVQTVGAGTPAAAAGLQAGDRLVAVNQQDVADREQFDAVLADTRPGQSIELQVRRDGQVQTLEAELQRRPLEVIRPESENVLLFSDKLPRGFGQQNSFGLTLNQVGNAALNSVDNGADDADGVGPALRELPDVRLLDTPWRVVEHDQSSATFQRRLPELGLQVTKRYRLGQQPNGEAGSPGYGLTLDVVVENLSNDPQTVAYRLDGPNGLPVEGWWYANKIGHDWGAVGLRDVIVRPVDGPITEFAPANIAVGDVDDVEGAPLAYLGVDAQYFTAMLIPQKEDPDELWIERAEMALLTPRPLPKSGEGRYANVTPRLISVPHTLAPGEKIDHSYEVFAGPKRPELLAEYRAFDNPAYSLRDLVTYGWFSGIAKAMLWVLHGFYSIVGNYGIAIILLTVLVRLCMFPISRKQAQSMIKLQELRPEMDRIKEKHKTDMQKQSQAMQELYRKHGVNPLAGCLPMLLQFPVFIGLYRGLAVDIELRQASLFGENVRWCSNLAAPDMLLDWSGFMPDFITRGHNIVSLGPYLNVLPLVTIGLFLLQQKMFMPEAANEQAAMQQKIMKYMMVFMGFLFYKVPSGLCLYFIASSAWGIAERKLLPKPTVADATPGADSPAKATSASRGGEKPRDAQRAAKNGKSGGSRRSKSKRRR